MKTTLIVCRGKCRKAKEVPRAVAVFWDNNSDIPYVCPACMADRIHDAAIQADAAAMDAFTAAFKIARTATTNPLPRRSLGVGG